MSISTEITRINNASNKIAAKASAMGLKDTNGLSIGNNSKIDVVADALDNVSIWTAGQPVAMLDTNGFEENGTTYWMPKQAEDNTCGGIFKVYPKVGYNKAAHVEIPVKDIVVDSAGTDQTFYAYQFGGLIASVTVCASEAGTIDGKTYAEVEAALAAI